MPLKRKAFSRCAHRRGQTLLDCISPRLVALDIDAGLLTLDAIDALDGTPVVDVKPYFASIDSFPDALPPRHRNAP